MDGAGAPRADARGAGAHEATYVRAQLASVTTRAVNMASRRLARLPPRLGEALELALDLKTPLGKQALTDLIKKSDVFIHNLGPGAVDRLGFGWEAVKVMNARVDLAEHAAEKIDILFDIAAIYESKIGRRAGAAPG